MSKQKYYTKITKEEMLEAQNDPEIAYDIILRMRPFLGYMAHIIYNFYGAKHDSSLSIEDIMSFLEIAMLKAIKSFDPSKYDASKDKSGGKWYTDGYRYLSTICKRSVKYFYNYHHSQKRIPPEFIHSLDPLIYNTESEDCPEMSALDLMLDNVLKQFSDTYISGTHVYDVMKLLFEGFSHEQIAEKMDIDINKVKDVIKASIGEQLTQLEMNQTLFYFIK